MGASDVAIAEPTSQFSATWNKVVDMSTLKYHRLCVSHATPIGKRSPYFCYEAADDSLANAGIKQGFRLIFRKVHDFADTNTRTPYMVNLGHGPIVCMVSYAEQEQLVRLHPIEDLSRSKVFHKSEVDLMGGLRHVCESCEREVCWIWPGRDVCLKR